MRDHGSERLRARGAQTQDAQHRQRGGTWSRDPRRGQKRPRGNEAPRADHEGAVRREKAQQLVEQEFCPERVAKRVEKGGQPGAHLNHPGQGARLAAVLLRRARLPGLPRPGTRHEPHPISSERDLHRGVQIVQQQPRGQRRPQGLPNRVDRTRHPHRGADLGFALAQPALHAPVQRGQRPSAVRCQLEASRNGTDARLAHRVHQGADGRRVEALTGVGEYDDVARSRPDSGVQRRGLATRLIAAHVADGATGLVDGFNGCRSALRIERDHHLQLCRCVGGPQAILHPSPHSGWLVARRDHDGDGSRCRFGTRNHQSTPPSSPAGPRAHDDGIEQPDGHERDRRDSGCNVEYCHRTHHAVCRNAAGACSRTAVLEPSATHVQVRRNPASSEMLGL